MKISYSCVFLGVSVLFGLSLAACDDYLKVNFAFGGAMTNGQNRAVECFGGLLRPCEEAELRKQQLTDVGLILPGLEQQLDMAQIALKNNFNANKDLFLLYAGGRISLHALLHSTASTCVTLHSSPYQLYSYLTLSSLH